MCMYVFLTSYYTELRRFQFFHIIHIIYYSLKAIIIVEYIIISKGGIMIHLSVSSFVIGC